MGEVVLFASVSVDGFCAGPGDDLERLHAWMRDDGTPADELTDDFAAAGAVLIGRRTYDAGQEPWGDEDVFDVPVFVATHQPREPVARNGTTFTHVAGTAAALLAPARAAAGRRDVVVMGSADVAQQLLRAGLVDVVTLHRVPVLLGRGVRLFADLDAPIDLVPDASLRRRGVTLERYRVTDRSGTPGRR
jgi:dihydrofolate reductase